MDWDVFISHAWEDKEEIARPLAEALRRKGLRVWYDEFALSLGDSLRRSIDRGLAQSKYGVVILSPHFFAKEWPQKELDGLAAREVSGEKVILPIWHNITADQIGAYLPTLADRVAVSSDRGLEHVVEELLRVIKPTPKPARPQSFQPEVILTSQVFISHATADAQFAHRLADDLRRLGMKVWIAPESIRPGEGWVRRRRARAGGEQPRSGGADTSGLGIKMGEEGDRRRHRPRTQRADTGDSAGRGTVQSATPVEQLPDGLFPPRL